MRTVLQTDIANHRVSRCQTESSSLVYFHFPTNIPRNWTLLQGFQAWKYAIILNGIDVRFCHALQRLFLRFIMMEMRLPAVLPCAPSPSRHVRREIRFTSFPFVRRRQQVQIRESCHVHHPLLIPIHVESFVHVFKIIRRSHDVVLQHNHRVMSVEHIGNALNDVALQIDILGALNKRDASQSTIRLHLPFHLMQVCPHLVHSFPRFLILSSIAKHIHVRLLCQGVPQQSLHRLLRVIHSIINEYGYGRNHGS